jgi:hypothetical protein
VGAKIAIEVFGCFSFSFFGLQRLSRLKSMLTGASLGRSREMVQATDYRKFMIHPFVQGVTFDDLMLI